MKITTNTRMVQPYLFFGGRCEEALSFYQQALGAKLEMILRFKDSPEPTGAPDNWVDKVMHASLRIGETTVMVSDGCWQEKHSGMSGFALSLSVPDEAEADRRFAALANGGQVRMPMEKTFFATRFGMVCDRFGVAWMVTVPADEFAGTRKMEAAVS